MAEIGEVELLRQLEPTVEKQYHKHMEHAVPWVPALLIPYDKAQSFPANYVWKPEDGLDIPDAARTSYEVNLLTEENLPGYKATITRMFGVDSPWGVWNNQWTSEEGAHGNGMREYATTTRILDPIKMEHDRRAQVAQNIVPEPEYALNGLVYVSFQEKATQIAHRNTGKFFGRDGRKLLARIAGDELNHHMFYRGVVAAALEIAPSRTVLAIEQEFREFKMPGTGIPNFTRKALEIGNSGIFGVRELIEEVIEPTLVAWKLDEVTGLTPVADAARDNIHSLLDRYKENDIGREKERRDRYAARQLLKAGS